MLQDPAICGFDEVQDLSNADKGAIEIAIDDLFQDRHRDDLVLLYFSGHGLLDADGRLLLALARAAASACAPPRWPPGSCATP